MKKLLGVVLMTLFSMSASADLAEQLAASGRSDADKARDAARRPAEVHLEPAHRLAQRAASNMDLAIGHASPSCNMR